MAERTEGGVQAVIFAMGILRYLSQQHAPVGVTALARKLNTTKNRIHRHLRTLVDLGYIVQDADSNDYSVGAELMVLGRAVGETFDLVNAAHATMQHLRDMLGHTTVVSRIEYQGIRAVHSLPGNHELEIKLMPGALLGYHTAQGKVALAFGSEESRDRVLSKALKKRTPLTVVSPDAIRRELVLVRERGWATAAGQGVLGLNSLAAPIFDVTGSIYGTIAILDSVQYISEQPSQAQVSAIVSAARSVSKNMGYTGDLPRRSQTEGGKSAPPKPSPAERPGKPRRATADTGRPR